MDTNIEKLNPMRSEPATRFDRSVDINPPGGGPGGGGGGFDGDWPLKLVKVDDENVKVTLGTINGIIPTDINTPIDVSGTDGTWTFFLHATLGADGIPTAVAVENDGAAVGPGSGVPTDNSDNAYLLIGLVDVASSVIDGDAQPSLAWSQTFVACGRDPDDPATTPGTYYWVVA